MNIIALDSADKVLSTALSTENGVWYTEADAGARHSEHIMDCADRLCKSAGIAAADIELAVCMKGPGSFTGLRIGFSAAKGISLSLGIPLIAVPTLDCLARHLSIWPGLVLPAIDAKKGCFFSAFYRCGKRLTEYMDAPVDLLAKEACSLGVSEENLLVLTGSGAEMLYPRLAEHIPSNFIKLDPEFGRGRARQLLEIVKYGKINQTGDINEGPFYLRKSDAELKLI